MPRRPDPRLLPGRTATVNGELTDRAIRHAIFLESWKGHEVMKVVRFLDEELLPDLYGQLERRLERVRVRGIDTSVASTQRLRDMIGSVRDTISEELLGAREFLQEDLVEFANYEAGFQVRSLEKTVPIKFDFLAPPKATLRAIVTQRPMEGHLLKDWWKGLERTTQGEFTRQINLGLAQGESTQQIVSRLRGTRAAAFGDGSAAKLRRQTEAVVRTAVAHTSSHVRDETYTQNQEIVKGWRFVATLDGRTTPQCRALDGKVFKVGEGPRPPLHVACRSTSVPVLKSWRELGIALDEAPPGTRASMDGQVAGTETYGTWLRKQSRQFQDEVLGPRRATLFRSGAVKIEEFVSGSGRLLSLKELGAVESRN